MPENPQDKLSAAQDVMNMFAQIYGAEPIKQREDFKGNLFSKTANYFSGSGNKLGQDVSTNAGVERKDRYGKLYDLYNYYFGQPLEGNMLQYSKYKPELSKDKNAKYVSVQDSKFIDQVLDVYNQLPSEEKNKPVIPVSGYMSDYKGMDAIGIWLGLYDQKRLDEAKDARSNTTAIGRFTLGKGKDKNGEYISYYDVFDAASGNEESPMLGTAKPYEIYDRIYVTQDSYGNYHRKYTIPQIKNSPIDKTKLNIWEQGANTFNITTKEGSNRRGTRRKILEKRDNKK